MSGYSRVVYPFTAIVGQSKMKQGLIFNAINPAIGGILIRGEKGTAKSTAVRALAAVLPNIDVVKGCAFNCNVKNKNSLCETCKNSLEKNKEIEISSIKVPVVELPVSATEDKVVGTLDFEYAIKNGEYKFEPGILAKANHGIIYVDEVNLLDDHIVDILLDASAMGRNIVERENISYYHLAEFILIGTMNPEEGELRPQLLDRFGLCVEIEGVDNPRERVEIIKRRNEFDDNPLEFIRKWALEEISLGKKIIAARNILPSITVSDGIIKLISKLCIEAFVSGHRADIVMERAARTAAAWHGRNEVIEEDVYEVAELVLLHRRGNDDSSRQDKKEQEKNKDQQENNKDDDKSDEEDKDKEHKHENKEKSHLGQSSQGQNSIENSEDNNEEVTQNNSEENQGDENSEATGTKEFVFSIGEPFNVKKIINNKDRLLRKGSGKRSNTKTKSKAGRYIRSTMNRENDDLALDATLRAAAPYQICRNRNDVAIAIESSDIRCKVREKRIGNFLLFVVDGSGSMGAQKRMVETKGAILSLLIDAYQKRDKVGMIAFKGKEAEVILPPTNSIELAHKLLEEMPTGGKTPLPLALDKAYMLCKAQLRKDINMSPLVIIISDGKANVSIGEDKPLSEVDKLAELISEDIRIKSLVIDVEKKGFLSFGLAKKLAENLGAQYYKIEDLKADTLVEAIKSNIG